MAWPSSWEKCGSFSFSFSQACWKSMVSTIQPCEQSCKKLFSLQPMQQDDWLQRQSLWASKRVCETWRTNFQFYQLLPLSPIGCSCNMFLLPDHHLLLPWDESYATEISAKQDANGQILHWELDLLPMKEQLSRIEKESHHSSLSLSLSPVIHQPLQTLLQEARRNWTTFLHKAGDFFVCGFSQLWFLSPGSQQLSFWLLLSAQVLVVVMKSSYSSRCGPSGWWWWWSWGAVVFIFLFGGLSLLLLLYLIDDGTKPNAYSLSKLSACVMKQSFFDVTSF